MQSPAAYDKASVMFHWVTAVAIIAMWPIGKVMVRGNPLSQQLYSTHVGLGLVIAGLTLARVIWMLRTQRPEELEMPRWEKILFVANHYVLYGLLGVLSLTGIVILLSAGSFDAIALAKSGGPNVQHEIASNIFLAMFVMHVGGVVYYQVTKGRTLRRMGVPLD